MSWLPLAWHWVLGHALFAGGLGALLAMLCSGPMGLAVLRWLIGTRPGVLVLMLWAAASFVTWQKGVSYAAGYTAGAAHSSALIAASATAAAQAEARASEAARNAEDTRGKAVNATAAAYEKGRADAEKRYSSLQQRIAAGDYVLRDEFRRPACPAAAPAEHSATPAAPAASPWVLSGAYLSASLFDAADAEGVLDDLYLCRDVLAQERAP